MSADVGPIFSGSAVGFLFAIPAVGEVVVELLDVALAFELVDMLVGLGGVLVEEGELGVEAAEFFGDDSGGVGAVIAVTAVDAGGGQGDICFQQEGDVFVYDLIEECDGGGGDDDRRGCFFSFFGVFGFVVVVVVLCFLGVRDEGALGGCDSADEVCECLTCASWGLVEGGDFTHEAFEDALGELDLLRADVDVCEVL